MTENRKKDIAKEYIKENILNKELVEIQLWFLSELNSLKQEIESFKNIGSDILWSEKPSTTTNENEEIFWIDDIMKILFNAKWQQRTKLWFEANKIINGMYLIISDEWKKNLDLLYESLQKAKSEQELKDLLKTEISELQNNVEWNTNSWDNQNENIWNNPWWYENLSSTENKEQHQVSEQYIYKQAKLYWVTDNRQIAYILATVKWECGFRNIKEGWWENKSYWKEWYYGRWFVQLTHKWNYEKFTKIIRESWLHFKDNNWNFIAWDDLDLVKNPDIILKSNDLASFILIYWMKNGSFTWKKLNDFINDNKVDYYNARRIINWISSSPEKYKNYAEEYLKKM